MPRRAASRHATAISGLASSETMALCSRWFRARPSVVWPDPGPPLPARPARPALATWLGRPPAARPPPEPAGAVGQVLYYTILYYTILYYTILYYTILYYYCAILYYTILHYTDTMPPPCSGRLRGGRAAGLGTPPAGGEQDLAGGQAGCGQFAKESGISGL